MLQFFLVDFVFSSVYKESKYSGFIHIFLNMIQKVSEPISVSFAYDSKKQKAYPKWVIWENRLYSIAKIGLHHTYHEGRTLYHVFSVATKTLFFRLVLDTENLHWRLEEISDGLAD
jgi:hypothetical protein